MITPLPFVDVLIYSGDTGIRDRSLNLTEIAASFARVLPPQISRAWLSITFVPKLSYLLPVTSCKNSFVRLC